MGDIFSSIGSALTTANATPSNTPPAQAPPLDNQQAQQPQSFGDLLAQLLSSIGQRQQNPAMNYLGGLGLR